MSGPGQHIAEGFGVSRHGFTCLQRFHICASELGSPFLPANCRFYKFPRDFVCPCVRPWEEQTTGQVYAVGMGQATSTISTQVSHGPDFDHSFFTSRGAGQPLPRDLASLVKVCEIQTSEENSAGPPSEYSHPQGPALPEVSEFTAVIRTSHAQ